MAIGQVNGVTAPPQPESPAPPAAPAQRPQARPPDEPTRARRKRPLLVLAVAALAVFGAIAAWQWWSGPPAGVLVASGNIESTEVHPSFKVSGRLLERPVDEGTRVERDQLIGRLESKDLEADAARLREVVTSTESQMPLLRTELRLREDLTASRIAQARATLAARQEYLAQVRAGSRRQEIQQAEADVRRARATLDNADADARRYEMLFQRGLVAAQARDASWTAYQVAAEQHRAAVEKLDLTREGSRAEEIRRAEADVRQAQAALVEAETGELDILHKRQELTTLEANIRRDRAALAMAEATLGYTVLRSPLHGVVLRKHVEPGETIAAGTPIVTIADLDDVWVKIYVPETSLGRVRLGQAAEVTTDSYLGKVYRGRVVFVSSEAEFTPKTIQTFEERVKLVFAVKVAVDNAAQELKPGMPADARLRLP